jgi:hypothetical protein
MTRYSKKNGKYHISGKSFSDLSGSRAQVWHGTAYKTPGGLTKNNLMKNKSGRIVSKSKHTTAKRENRLVKNGYGTKKGQFGFVKLNGHSSTKRSKSSKRMKGGAPYGNNFSPSSFSGSGTDGQGLTDYGGNSTNVQLAAGMSGGRRRKRGGALYALSPASVKGLSGSQNSIGVQLAAGMAGGRRRRKRGGTTKHYAIQNSNNPLNMALGYS